MYIHTFSIDMRTKKKLLIVIASVAILCSCDQKTDKHAHLSGKPNILLIVADDLGYSDIAPFGGNIHTPVITELSKEGISFSNFHVQPTCSPTRASLLTGNDNHVAGIGIMSEMAYPELTALKLPGYQGALSKQVVTIPEVLQESGYHTYMVGKWHLGEDEGQDPYDRGFEETFILGTGGGSHWADRRALSPLQHMDYTRNGKPVDLPENFYSSKNYTDSIIGFIDKNKKDKNPFFIYLSYTAVHDPLHVPEDYIAKYKGKFDMGWDSLWAERLENLKALGIVSSNVNKFSKSPMIPAWESLSPEIKSQFARDMEVYAGMLEYLDMSIGRLLDYLKKEGMYDNTLIIFMSDNGANGATSSLYPGNEDGKYLSTFDNSLDNRGLENSYIETGSGWAQASSSPFRYFKSFASEGGIKVPLIIKMPGKSDQAGEWNDGFIHVTDIMPTILELANAPYPDEYKGNAIHPLIGESIMPVLKGDSLTVHTNDGYGWELFEMKAYIKNDWKLLRLPEPMGTGKWELYNIKSDPAEAIDLSDQYPDLTSQLIKEWERYAKRNEVIDHQGHYDVLYRKNYMPAEKD